MFYYDPQCFKAEYLETMDRSLLHFRDIDENLKEIDKEFLRNVAKDNDHFFFVSIFFLCVYFPESVCAKAMENNPKDISSSNIYKDLEKALIRAEKRVNVVNRRMTRKEIRLAYKNFVSSYQKIGPYLYLDNLP